MDRFQFTIRDLLLTTTIIAVACLCAVCWDTLHANAFLIAVVVGGMIVGIFVGAPFNQMLAGAVIVGFLVLGWCTWMMSKIADGLGGI